MRCSIFGPNAFSTRRAMSLVRAAFSLSKLESACLPTPSALDASVTVSPSGSITSRRITPPTCGGFFIAILQIPPLMIVHQIKVKCVTLLEPEDHPPVTAHGDAPESFQLTLQRIQPPTGKQTNLLRVDGFVDRPQDVRYFLHQSSRKIPSLPRHVEPL